MEIKYRHLSIAGIVSLDRPHKMTMLPRQKDTQYRLQTLHRRQISDCAAQCDQRVCLESEEGFDLICYKANPHHLGALTPYVEAGHR